MNAASGVSYQQAAVGHNQFTVRQEQVVRLAANGMGNKEIARILGISKRTVEDHFIAARQRIGAANRVELITRAILSGIDVSANTETGRSCSEKDGFLDSRPGRPTVMTHQRLAEARQLLRVHTVTQVARELGVSRTTLYAHLATINAGERNQQFP